MKILVVQESDWLNRNPHQQHHLFERLAKRGHVVRVIDYDIDWKKRGGASLIGTREVFDGIHKIIPGVQIQVIRPVSVRAPVLEYLALFIFHRSEISRQIREYQPDVIVGFGILNAYAASRLARKHHIPFIYYWIDVLDTLIPEGWIQWLGRSLEVRTNAASARILVINARLLEHITLLGAERGKTMVLGAGIDLSKFQLDISGRAVREKYLVDERDILLFFMGFLYHFSGLKEVIAGLMNGDYNGMKLLIVGDGDAYEDLRELVTRFGLEDRVFLTGRQPYDAIPGFIAAADVCILPADPHEKIMQHIVPIKLYEYLAMQKPVITTTLPGIMTEFGTGNGVSYVQEPVQVLGKVLELVRSGELGKEGASGRRYVEKRDWDVVTDQFENILGEVAGS
jgi:glycosyltransferase involved in cell wall biosynthesis